MEPVDAAETYGPDAALVAVWVVIVSVPFGIWSWIYVGSAFAPSNLPPLLVTLALPTAVLVFALRFRVSFTPERFIYRRWGPTIDVAYKEISRIEVTNLAPVGKAAVGAFIVTHCGQRLPFWPKLFPRSATSRFFQLVPIER